MNIFLAKPRDGKNKVQEGINIYTQALKEYAEQRIKNPSDVILNFAFSMESHQEMEITVGAAIKVLEHIFDKSEITTLNFLTSKLTSDILEEFAFILSKEQTLEEIDFSSNPIGHDLKPLLKILEENSGYKKISIADICLTNKEATKLSDFLVNYKKVETLNLNDNQITDSTLFCQHSLERIFLERNEIIELKNLNNPNESNLKWKDYSGNPIEKVSLELINSYIESRITLDLRNTKLNKSFIKLIKFQENHEPHYVILDDILDDQNDQFHTTHLGEITESEL